jgi:hypothetical protein
VEKHHAEYGESAKAIQSWIIDALVGRARRALLVTFDSVDTRSGHCGWAS